MKSVWYTLDSTAKIMPSMTTRNNTNVFRISCSLKENIDEDILQQALDKSIKEFPYFLYTMKDGLFWHYLEKTNIEPKVLLDKRFPCSTIKNGLLFQVTYYKKRINLEVYHVLSDGNGAMEFLKYLVCTYIEIKHKLNINIPINSTSTFEKEKDDFQTFDKSTTRIKVIKNKSAYKLKLPRKENIFIDVLEMHLDTDKVKKAAKKYNVTVSVYLISLYIKSIIENMKLRELNKPVGISVPVDLRNIYGSKTSRNFFFTVVISYQPNNINSIDVICKEVNEQLKNHLKKENIQSKLNTYMLLEKIIFIRMIPNFIKDFGLKYITKLAKKSKTSVFSNLGLINVPDEYKDYIDSFQALSPTEDIQLTVCSFKNEMVLTFTSHFISKGIEKSYLNNLRNDVNSHIKVISNIKDE